MFDFVLGSAILLLAEIAVDRERGACACRPPGTSITWVPVPARLWLMRYAPELRAVETRRFPPIAALVAALGPGTEVHPVPVPQDCADGFVEAYYGRPEAILDPAVRAAQSGWGFLEPGVEDWVVRWLAADLQSGAWDDRWGSLRTQPEFHGAVRLVVGRADEPAG